MPGWTQEVIAGQQIEPYPAQAADDAPAVVEVPARVGPAPADRRRVRFTATDLATHMFLLGAIGSGKTNLLMHVATQVRRQLGPADGLLCFDSKGDFLARLHRPGDVTLAPLGATPFPERWNLFAELKTDGDAHEMAARLFANRVARSTQPFFPRAAQQLFAAMLLHLRRTQTQVDNQVLCATWAQAAPLWIAEQLRAHSDFQALAAYLDPPDSEMALGIFAEVQQAVRDIFVDAFAQAGGVSVRDFAWAPARRALFIVYDAARGVTLTPAYRTLVDGFLQAGLSRGRPQGRLYVIIDEFRLLPRLAHLEDALNFGRELGVRIILAAQSVSQVYAGYEEHVAASILAGFGTQILFRANDGPSRTHAQSLLGRNLSLYALPATPAMTPQLVERAVLQDHQLATLRTGQAILAHPPLPPRWAQFDLYRDEA